MLIPLVIGVTGWLLGWWAFGRVRSLEHRSAAQPATGGVTIVIPARNEELSLPNLLADLAAARPAHSRVIVVDDHSSDRTAAIAESHDFVELIPAPPLPEGWTGKSWACHTGASRATGEWIIFLDADVRVLPGALDALLADLVQQGGLVTVQPWHRTERPYEQLSALFNTIAIMGAASGTERRPCGAFGPVLATSVRSYGLVGGHESVRSAVVEDLALAQRYHEHRLGVHVALGRGDFEFRMYPAGIRQLAEGWTKNFASGASSTSPVRLLAIILWITALASSSLNMFDAARGHASVAVAVALYAAFGAQLALLFRRVGSFSTLTALGYPLLVVFFVGVFSRSLWRTYVRRSVRWRDRQIELRVPAA
jgi:4,4'-diaponeurosporenoate glycosyltransferase